jgi:hypothetical protein
MPYSAHKRSYHPLLIVLFHLQLLSKDVLKQIPHSTRAYWNHILQQEQFGYDAVKDYLHANLDIRAVYESKQVFRVARFVCRIYDGYKSIVGQVTHAQKQSKEFCKSLTETISYLKQYVNVNIAARIMNTTYQSCYRLRNKITCAKSKRGKCFRSLPQQLSMRELQVIDSTVNDPDNFNARKVTLYYRLINAGKLFCSLSTFYEYAKTELKPFRKPTPVRETLRATRLFQYLHVDITEMINSTGKHYIAFVKDNFSKAILGYGIFFDRSSSNIRELFERVFLQQNLHQCPERISIVSDGGSENKGELLLWIAQQVIPEVKKLTAGIDVKSNSMSESVHHILKNEFLRGKIPEDIPAAIARFTEYYNNERYPVEHFGYTCNEVLNGAKPDPKRFAEKIRAAKKIRIEENRNFSCVKKVGCSIHEKR